MQESTLLKIALLVALLGVSVLFFISQNYEAQESPLLEKDTNYVVKGTVSRVTQLDSVTFIELQKEDLLPVVLFKNYPVDVNKGDYVEILGKAGEDQQGNLQFNGKELRVIK